MSWRDREYNQPQHGGSGGGGFGGGGPTGGGGGGESFLHRLNRFFNYSIPIGTYLSTRVRVHITFVIIVGLYVLSQGDPWWTLHWTGILFLSVLLHEFGHILGCRAVGGRADEILMWPLGGLAFCDPPHRPMAHFITVICGPLVNFALAAAAYTALALAWADVPVTFNPFDPLRSVPTGVQLTVALVFILNYYLMLFNLALLFLPMDGGRIVQTALWGRLGYVRSMMVSTRVGIVAAVVTALVGVAARELLVIIIALIGFMTCYQLGRQIKQMAAHGGFDAQFSDGPEFDPGYYSDAWRDGGAGGMGGLAGAGAGAPGAGGERREPKPGLLARRRAAKLKRKRDAHAARQAQFDADIDRILAKVKDRGLQSLSGKEKRLLQKATQMQKEKG